MEKRKSKRAAKLRNKRTKKTNKTNGHDAAAAVAIELGAANFDVQNPAAETSSNTVVGIPGTGNRKKVPERTDTGSNIYTDDKTGVLYKHNPMTGTTSWMDSKKDHA